MSKGQCGGRIGGPHEAGESPCHLRPIHCVTKHIARRSRKCPKRKSQRGVASDRQETLGSQENWRQENGTPERPSSGRRAFPWKPDGSRWPSSYRGCILDCSLKVSDAFGTQVFSNLCHPDCVNGSAAKPQMSKTQIPARRCLRPTRNAWKSGKLVSGRWNSRKALFRPQNISSIASGNRALSSNRGCHFPDTSLPDSKDFAVPLSDADH